MRKLKLRFICAAAVLLFGHAAYATPISVDAGWYGFCFGGAGDTVYEGCQNQGIGTTSRSSEFSSTSAMLLKVTDAFQFGDVFDVYVNSVLAFTTGGFDAGGTSTTDPDIAFDGGEYSSGSILLAAGAYTVEILVAASPFGGGGAYIEVESASVPEPGTLALLGIGLLGLGMMRREKKA